MAEKRQQTKSQHTTPRMHLQHFAGVNPLGHVWVYDGKEGTRRSSAPENTGIMTHFYSAPLPGGKWDTRLEDHLSLVESKAAPIYRSLLKGQMPATDQERADMSTFVALMFFRTTTMRRNVAEDIGRRFQFSLYEHGADPAKFDALVAKATADGTLEVPKEMHAELRETFMNPSGYVLTIPHDRTLPALEGADLLAPVLFEMKWTVVSVQHGFFITSDNPVLLSYSDSVGPGTSDPFRHPHARIIFPLSPYLSLHLSWNKRAPLKAQIGRKDVESFNVLLVQHSDRFLYAHIDHKAIAKLAVQVGKHRPPKRPPPRGVGQHTFARVRIGKGRL